MQRHGPGASAVMMLLALIAMLVPQCTKTARDTGDTIPEKNTELVREYLKEGFISDDLFRVVIVTPQGDRDTEEAIEKKAKQRALMSLQKYLAARNMTVTRNTRIKLLHLTERGTLIKRDDTGETRRVYLFEITGKNLKHQVDSLPAQR